nr:EOG090X0HZC [Artemia franciscana]
MTVQQQSSQSASDHGQILSKQKLQELAREVDPTLQLDEELEELILAVADDFIESSVNAACHLAKHRKSNILEAKDLLLHLERNYNMWTPGYGTDELRTFKKAPTAEAHRQRMALIRKTLKKY